VKSENERGISDESLSALENLNTKFVCVVEGSKFKVVFKQYDPILKRDYWVRMTPQDFTILHSNKRIERDKTGLSNNASDTIPLGKGWIEWPKRNQVDSVVFDPEREHPGFLNLWDGFAIEPSAKGEWSFLNELIFEVLSDGSDDIYQYILNWLRFMFQNPGKRAEVALVMRGGRGVGKGTLGNVVSKLIGRHAIAIASPELITGRFNSHLQDVIFLFADEAIRPFDKQAESRLKAFITEPLLAFEGKGRDAVVGHNNLHIMMASNESWVVPAALDERRFLVTDCNAKWQRDFKRFELLWGQLHQNKGSGFRRMIFDLLKTPIPPGWHPARNIPSTGALVDQKIRSLSPMAQWLFNAATEKIWPFPTTRHKEMGSVRYRCFYEDFKLSFHSWMKEQGIKPGGFGRSNVRFMLQDLKEIFPDANTQLRIKVPDDRSDVSKSPSDGRAQAIEIPSFKQARKAFEIMLGGSVSWSEADADEWG
jgi:hypothetical protein